MCKSQDIKTKISEHYAATKKLEHESLVNENRTFNKKQIKEFIETMNSSEYNGDYVMVALHWKEVNALTHILCNLSLSASNVKFYEEMETKLCSLKDK